MRPPPNPLPRPDGELQGLERAWRRPTGWRALTVVNNTSIGLLYIATALLFFLLAGVLALLMRTQLAVPDNALIGHALYNQLFTMHGTVMMFLFAVPAVEAVAVLLLPNMLGARDLPFPRLSAYAYWAYAIGGLVFFCSIFVGLAPDGGWFMYPPLTSTAYSPALNADLWLLGRDFNYQGDKQQWAYGGRNQRRNSLAYPALRGANQLLNAAAALAALEALRNVLPVGGIKEKFLAARRAGIKTIILPAENRQNVEEDLTPQMMEGVSVHYASRIEDVLDVALPLLKTRRPAPEQAHELAANPAA